MNRLLSADFARLRRDKVFWIGVIAMFALGLWRALGGYFAMQRTGAVTTLDSVFFTYVIPIGVILAAFCSLFIGTQHSDGAIRNKLIVGHSRQCVYLANLIVCTAAGLLITLAYLAAVCLVGVPLLGFFHTDLGMILLLFGGTLLMIAALCALFVLLCMQNQNKAVLAVLCIIGFGVLLLAATYLSARLSAPEFYDGYVFLGENGAPSTQPLANPDYLRGIQRQIAQFFLDFLPTGQVIQYAEFSAVHLWQMPLYSLLIGIAATLSGVFAFRKKDIK